MKTDAQIIDDVILREGDKYTNHPADRGGPTRYGVTLKTLARFRSAIVTAYDVQMLSLDEARAIYQRDYVRRPGFQRIQSDALRGLVVDAAIQHGPEEPIEWLQREAGVLVDGDFGPKSAAAVNAMPEAQIYAGVLARRCQYYGKLITSDPVRVQATKAGYRSQAENAAGWANRLSEFIRELRLL